MMPLEDIQRFLPTFLSHGSESAFVEEIRRFHEGHAQPFYTSRLSHEPLLFQGDGVRDFLLINLPDPQIRKGPGLLLSNTCDASLENKRFFDGSLSYAPIFRLDAYLDTLLKEHASERIAEHARALRGQEITQIFFLPKGGGLAGDSLVFLDRTMTAPTATVDRSRLNETRLFTLTDFGAWLLALKLSVHFCRVRDRVDRNAGVIG